MSGIEKHFEKEIGDLGIPMQGKAQNVAKIEETPYQLSSNEIMEGLRLADAVSSKEMASVAGRVLRSETESQDARRLAGSVLRQYIKDFQSVK